MTSLILRKRTATAPAKPYRLEVRDHGPAETDYGFVCALDSEAVVAVLRTGRVHFLYDDDTGLTERAAAAGRDGALKVRWERDAEYPKEFSLSWVSGDGTRLLLAMLAYGIADEVVDTECASWEGGHPMEDPEYEAAGRRRRVRELRAEADRIESSV